MLIFATQIKIISVLDIFYKNQIYQISLAEVKLSNHIPKYNNVKNVNLI